jgi:hypothetical protein
VQGSEYTEVTINESPRPRLLVYGLKDREAEIAKIMELAPASKRCESLSEVRQQEWDILVTDHQMWMHHGSLGAFNFVSEHMCVVFVTPAAPLAGQLAIEIRPDWSAAVGVRNYHVSQELKRILGLPERISALVHEQLEPLLKIRPAHQYFTADMQGPVSFPNAWEKAVIEPFITTGAGNVLAGRYKRSSTSEAWLLPGDTPDVASWVRAALAEWHSLAPDRFPGVPDWSEQPEWMTAEERDISAKIKGIQHQREVLLDALDAQEKDLRRELRDAQGRASQYQRALLTSQSDSLKDAVIWAFGEIGFQVTDADLDAVPDDHLEDLRIQDADAPEWIALAEVKGYTKGAKTEALTQLMRFNVRYLQRTGKAASASWYVVNQFLNRDPSARQSALNGKDDDVAAFAAGGGLVIDSVTLFNLLRLVHDGKMEASRARELLRSTVGRLEIPTIP